jgi:hypothetical protein
MTRARVSLPLLVPKFLAPRGTTAPSLFFLRRHQVGLFIPLGKYAQQAANSRRMPDFSVLPFPGVNSNQHGTQRILRHHGLAVMKRQMLATKLRDAFVEEQSWAK